MSAIKCPACGHRHFQVVSACLNCGEPLVEDEELTTFREPEPPVTASPSRPQRSTSASTTTPPKRIATRSSRTDADIAEYERRLAERDRLYRQEAGEEAPETYAQPSNSKELQTYVPRAPSTEVEQPARWKKQTMAMQPYAPYETSIEVSSPDPFQHSSGPNTNGNNSSGAGATHIRIEEMEEKRRVEDPQYWKTEKFPFGFLRTKPNISGTVIHMESKEEILDHPNFFAALAILAVEIVWVIIDIQQERDSDRIMMTVMRVQLYDGTLRDARIRGNMRGANVSLGDEVSLWGWKQKGIVTVERGYNHTTKGVISTQSIGLIMPAVIVILVVVLGVYFLPSWLPLLRNNLGPFFSQFFSSLMQGHWSLPMQHK